MKNIEYEYIKFLGDFYQGNLKIGKSETFVSKDSKVSVEIEIVSETEIKINNKSEDFEKYSFYGFRVSVNRDKSLSSFMENINYRLLSFFHFSFGGNVKFLSVISPINIIEENEEKELISAFNDGVLAISHLSKEGDYYKLTQTFNCSSMKIEVFDSDVLSKLSLYKKGTYKVFSSMLINKSVDDRINYLKYALKIKDYVNLNSL